MNLNLIMVFLISANYSWIGTTRAIYLSIQSCWAADPMCLVSGNFRWIINCKWNNKRPQKNSEFLSSSFPGILASWKNLSTKLRIFELYQFSTRTINISELCTEIHILYWDLWHHIISNDWNLYTGEFLCTAEEVLNFSMNTIFVSIQLNQRNPSEISL